MGQVGYTDLEGSTYSKVFCGLATESKQLVHRVLRLQLTVITLVSTVYTEYCLCTLNIRFIAADCLLCVQTLHGEGTDQPS